MAPITIVTQPGSRLTKRQMVDGTFEVAGTVYNAEAQTIEVSLPALAEWFNNDIDQNQALILGTAVQESPYKLISEAKKANGADGITRTKGNFIFAEEASLMLLDIDYKQCSSQISSVDPVRMLERGLGIRFGYVRRASTTAGITDPDGAPVEGGGGWHIYVTVQKGVNIPRMLELINDRLILAGYGFVYVTEAGTGLIRTPVDVAVGSPERVVYEAAPVLLDGYKQQRATEHVDGDLLVVTTLNADEEAEVKRLEQALKAEAQPKMDETKKAWCEARGLTEEQADKVLRSRELHPEFVLTNNDNTTFTVAEVWANPDAYHKLSFRDPIEPEYGKTKAKIFVNDDGSIIINSMAHGADACYRLQQTAEMMFGDVVQIKDFMNAPVTQSGEREQEPAPLPSGLSPVATYDDNLLPEALRGFVHDIAERMQCPPDFPAVSLMVSLATLIGRRCGIYPKREDDWLVVPNLWGAVVGRPSLMKSPATQEAMRPLDALIAESVKKYKSMLELFEISEEVYAGQKEAWKKVVRKNAADGKLAEIPPPPEKPTKPIEHRLRTNSGSVECLISLMNDNPDGLLVFRDELTGWLRILDKPGKEGDRQFFLEAWNGNGSSFDYDTFTHGHLHCDGLCLSLLGSIQPGPLSRMIADAAKGGGGDDGMVQRFQLMVYPDGVDKWRNIDRKPDIKARERVNRLFERLDSMEFPSLDKGISALRFAPSAQDSSDNWREKLEAKIREETNTMIEAHLAKYRSLMPSLALLLHLATVADVDAALTPVSLDAVTRAIAWCEYLESHARRIYGMQAMAEVEGAKSILQKLKQGDLISPFTLRQVYSKHWSGLATVRDAESACNILVDHGYLCASQSQGVVGRPTTKFTVSPNAFTKGTSASVSKVTIKASDPLDTALPQPLSFL